MANRKKKTEKKEGFSTGARIMAIVMIAIMVIFTVVTAGLFLLD